MTVPTTTARIVHDGNDVATVFGTDFVFLDADSLTVTLVDATGDESEKVLNTDYTVSGGEGTTGSVACTTFTPATGEFLVIERAEAYLQETDLLTADPFSAVTIETTFDKVVMMIQQLLDLVRRAVTLPLTYTGDPVTLPAPEDGKFLQGRSDLTGWDNVDLDDVVGVAAIALPVSVANGGTANTNAAALDKENYVAATGSANAYAVTLSPAPGALAAGMSLRFKANHTADGPPTLNVNSLGDVAILDGHGVALANGGLQNGGIYEVSHNGTNWLLTGFSRPFVSKLTTIREYNSNNTWSKPDDIDYIEVEMVGGGGGGGGTPATSSNEAAAAGGGGSGETAFRRVGASNLSATETVVVGSAGAGGSAGANAGSDGGASSFGGSLLTAAGGKGGAAGAVVQTGGGDNHVINLGGLGGTGGSGGTNTHHVSGFPGRAGICAHHDGAAHATQLGDGGGPGGGQASLAAGQAGQTPGAGGAGAAADESTAAQAGGAGKKGRVIVKEYTLAYV